MRSIDKYGKIRKTYVWKLNRCMRTTGIRVMSEVMSTVGIMSMVGIVLMIGIMSMVGIMSIEKGSYHES